MSLSNSKKYHDILEAALEEFADKSYDDASLNHIIKVSGTSKGTFYYYFKDKEDLYIQLLQRSIDKKWDYINSQMAKQTSIDASIDIFAMFEQQARLGLNFAYKFPLYYKMGKRLVSEQGKPIYKSVSKKIDFEGTDRLMPLIESSLDAGILDQHYDKHFLLEVISFHFQHFDELFSAEDLLTVEDNLKKLLYFLKKGLGSKRYISRT